MWSHFGLPNTKFLWVIHTEKLDQTRVTLVLCLMLLKMLCNQWGRFSPWILRVIVLMNSGPGPKRCLYCKHVCICYNWGAEKLALRPKFPKENGNKLKIHNLLTNPSPNVVLSKTWLYQRAKFSLGPSLAPGSTKYQLYFCMATAKLLLIKKIMILIVFIKMIGLKGKDDF